jgi:pimeloyl-ACP methyl ester carboxylesterase
MTTTDEAALTRVVSRDGIEIAYWTSGGGPPLVLVHGTTADHTRWRPLLPYLEPHATVHAMDRRGRGAAAAHTITRETRAELGAAFDPATAANMTVPTLMLVGGDSQACLKADYETVAAALPDVRVAILDGQQHIAMDLIPEVFAEHVVAFLRDRP